MAFERHNPLPRGFTRIAWSSVLTQSAEQVALTATPLAAVLILGVGATETALLQVAQTIPFLLLSIPLGVVVDRVPQKRVLVASEVLRALTLLGVVVLIFTGTLTFAALFALGLAGAIGTVGLSVATPASVPRVVPRDRLVDANRWLELGRSIAFICGPVLAGALVSLSNATTAFVVATIVCVAAVALLARVSIPRGEAAPRGSALREVRDGLRFALRNEFLRPMISTSMIFNIGWFLIQSVFVVYALNTLGMTPMAVGIAMGVYGAGMVVGALAARRLSKRFTLGRLSVVGPICGFIASVLIALTLWLPTPLLAFLSFFIFGFGPVLWTISTTALRQAVTPIRMMGRVSSLLIVATYGARPIGAGLGVLISAGLGMQWCVGLAVVVFAAQLAIVLFSRLPSVRELPAFESQVV